MAGMNWNEDGPSIEETSAGYSAVSTLIPYLAFMASREAITLTHDNYPKATTFRNSEADAFRRAIWSNIMGRRIKTAARNFGDSWEREHPYSKETAMDLYNNRIGRNLAADYPDMSTEDAIKVIKNLIDAGVLVTEKPSDKCN